MRIFQVIENSTNLQISSNRTWYRNLHEPLIDMGHDVVLFSAEEGRTAMVRGSKKLRADFSQKLLDVFRKEHARSPFQLFFAYLMDGMVDPGVIDEIKRTGVPTCNFSCNNVHQFYLVDELSPHFDYNLHAEKNVRDKFMSIGANPLWWPMASNPKYFAPLDVARSIDVSFVGVNYALRPRYIHYLLKHGIDVHAYGPGWTDYIDKRLLTNAKRFYFGLSSLCSLSIERQSRFSARFAELDFQRSLNVQFPNNLHAPIEDSELIALYSRSRISLGFLEVFESHDPNSLMTKHVHLREFEAPMCGALYCTGYLEELLEFFEPDKEIIMYNSFEELLDKINYYLAHPVEADIVRKAGRQRALRDHTYHKRFERLFAEIHVS